MRRILFGYFILSFLLVIINTGKLYSDTEVSSEVDLKKRADRYFTAENYEKALPDYSRLLSIYPHETIYNYRFGVCLLLSGKEKSNAATYLETSSKDPAVSEDVWYYLGKSFMINNEFSKATEAFEKFKTAASTAKQKKFEIDACIKNCESGISLSKTRKNVVIEKSIDVERKTFFNNYDFSTTSGKIVNAADQFLTEMDRAKQNNNVMFIGNDKQKILISSYGKNGETGKDIYIIRKTADNQWSQPENISATINSPADEDFPFLDHDGRTLYFSSKGFNSIGGYDIFKSVFNFNTNQWSAPENLGIPVNTPGDDFLFVPGENGSNVTYATTVESPNNSIAIRKIKLPKGKNEMLTISGTYIPEDQKMRRDARISILTSSGDGIITSVHTDPSTGKYELVLQPGQNYMIVVEGGGYLPHAEMFDLPSGMVNPDLKQVVKINKKDQVEELTLQNYFSSAGSSQPSKSITRSYSTKIDSSSMMSVKINDQIIYVTAPSVNKNDGKEETLSSSEKSLTENAEKFPDETDSLPSVNIKRKDKYDPTLIQGYSSDQIKQKEEETGRLKEVKDDEANPEKSLDINVSNEELAKIAYNDAKAIQDEADSVKNEIDVLRVKAVEKQELSNSQKNQSEAKGIGVDSSASLMTHSETNHIEADELSRQADALEIIASSKQAEAKSAVDEANSIFKNNVKSSEALAAGNKKSSKNNHEKNSVIISDKTKTESIQNNEGKESSDLIRPDSVINGNKSSIDSPVPITQNPADVIESPLISEEVTLPGQSDNTCNDVVVPKSYDQNETTVKDSSGTKSEINKPVINEPTAVNLIKSDHATPIGRFLSNEIDTSENKSKENSGNHQEVNSNNLISGETKNAQKNVSIVDTLNKAGNLSDVNNKSNNPVDTLLTPAAGTNNVKDSSSSTTLKNENIVNNKVAETNIPSENNADAKNNLRDTSSAGINSNPVIDNKSAINSSVDSSHQDNDLQANYIVGVIKNDKPLSTINLSGNKPQTFGAHHTDSVFALSDAMIKKNAPLPVKEEAKVAYRQYQAKMKHSNELTTQSLGLQEEISRLHPSPERDNLIRESNQAALESIHEWQEALKLIQEARKIDPGVEYKMNVNDYASNINKNKNDSLGKASTNPEQLQADALITKTSQSPDGENKTDYTSGSTDSSIKYFQDKSETDANLDTLHPDYPEYVKLKKDINDKQVETIDIFAEAINLNKKSIEEKEREIALMDSAQAEPDKDKKSALIKLSFEQKALSEKHASEAKEKFAIAQKHTQEVKGMKSELASVKERITLKPDQNNLTASTLLNSNNIKPLTKSGKSSAEKSTSAVKPFPVKSQSMQVNPDLVKQNPVFTKANVNDVNFIASEEEIESVDVTKNNLDKFMVDVFGKNESPFYSEKNSIPMDPVLPNGLVFKVQIGAFHKPLPSDIFKGIQPISGETTRPGWIRYCAGLFKAFEPANIVKKEIQKVGYKDAFVVAYYNGKRIELNDAYAMLRANDNRVAYKSESAKEIAMLRAINIHDESNNSLIEDKDADAFYGNASVPEKNISKGIREYAVQLGVYRTPKAPAFITSVKPLQTVPSQSNLYRFTTGRFNNYNVADSVKRQMVKSGIKDAFVVTYKNGVVLNSDEVVLAEKPAKNSVNENISDPSFLANQLVFTIQIGAYKNNIPYNMIESYMQIVDKGIFERTNERGLHVFYAGNFKTFNDASVLEAEIVSKGIKDAFVVALSDGKRIPINDEMKK